MLGRPILLYIFSKVGESAARAASAMSFTRRSGWSFGTRSTRVLRLKSVSCCFLCPRIYPSNARNRSCPGAAVDHTTRLSQHPARRRSSFLQGILKVEIHRILENRNTSKRWLAIAIATTVLVALLPLALLIGKDGEGVLPSPEVRPQADPSTPSRASTFSKRADIPLERHPPSNATPTQELITNDESSDIVQRLIEIGSIASQVQVSALLQRNADKAVKTVESYCERARQLKERSPFEPHRQIKEGGEAAYFLAPLIDWFTAQARMPDWAPQRIGLLHLPETVTARINAAGQNWPTTLSHADVGQLDFGWMRQTLAYTYWSLAAAGPLAELDGEPDLGVLAPDYRFFLNWAKLRYMEALRRGDLEEATIEVQHLAMLIHTNEGAIPDNLAVQVLNLAAPALEVAAQRGILPTGLVPPDPTVLAQFRDLSRAGESYFR